MKFKKRHNGIEPGTPFQGGVKTGRFLYQRGVLEPNGHPDDEAITRNPGPRARQRWGFEEMAAEPAPPAPAPSLDDIILDKE